MTLIVKASFPDIEEMVKLLQYLFEQEVDFNPQPQKQRKALEMILENPAMGSLFVAKKNGKSIGMVSLLYTISTAMGGKVAILEDMIVAPEFRNQGIGSALLDHARQYAFKNNCQRLTLLTDLDNQKAHSFYQNKGFRMSGMVPFRLLP